MIWFVMATMISAGAYGCILDLFCLVDLTMIMIMIYVWWLVLCAIHAFHNFWEFATPPIWRMRTPLILSDYLRGLPSIWLWRIMVLTAYMIWYVSGLVVDDYPFFFLFYYSFIYSLFYFPNALYFSSVSLSLLCICICSLGFLSSAAFPFPAAGFSRKLGYGKRVWLDLEDYALD